MSIFGKKISNFKAVGIIVRSDNNDDDKDEDDQQSNDNNDGKDASE